jgi:peptidoglycan hydrolase-like protein with peptidoglycan-binding domain
MEIYMKQLWKALMLASLLGTFVSAYQEPVSQSQPHPSGTVVTKNSHNTEVQPVTKTVGISPDIIRTAQQKLNNKGYKAGPATGKVNAQTRRAIHNFQKDEKLTVTGKLDENTLSHLNVGGSDTLGAAPADIGRGGKAAGHDIMGGHPIAATKAMGVGIGRSGKKVGEGTKSLAVSGKDKVSGEPKTNDAPK